MPTATAPSTEPEYLTLQEVADTFRVSIMTIYKLRDEKRCPCVRVGHKYRVRRSELDRWAEQIHQES